jgi:hypothetical protein
MFVNIIIGMCCMCVYNDKNDNDKHAFAGQKGIVLHM